MNKYIAFFTLLCFSIASQQASLSSSDYLAPVASSSHGFLLNHSTGGLPNGFEIDAPIVYADYYFLEALVRQKNKK